MTLLLISFIAGVLTILAPCTLPLLPVIIGGSISDGENKHRPLVVIGSLVASIVLFTIILKYSTALIGVPETVWQVVSGVLLSIVALAYIFPNAWARIPFIGSLSQSSNKVLATGFQKKNVKGDIIIGMALGPVFSSCSPTYFVILATILPRSFGEGVVHLLVYALGLGLSLLLIARAGQTIITKLGWAVNPNGVFKKVIGILFLLVGILVMTGVDKKIQSSLVAGGLFDITKVETAIRQKITEEDSTAVQKEETASETKKEMVSTSLTLNEKNKKYKKYEEIAQPAGFVNTNDKPIKLADYVGKKVILLDFMTYSCINCQRTFPYVRSWYEKYKDDGLIVVGIHTPEFGFEKVKSNVEKAMQEFGLTFPVVLDNNYGTWTAYANQYWPRKYLIDIDGYVVYDHIGEGDYDKTEQAIQSALMERAERLGEELPSLGTLMPDTSEDVQVSTPELYFGSDRNEYLGNGRKGVSGIQSFTLPSITLFNLPYLVGSWNITPEYAEANSENEIVLKYGAKNVYMVASANNQAQVQVFKDDILIGKVSVFDEKLYTLINDTESDRHTIRLIIPKGVRVFTFTFG